MTMAAVEHVAWVSGHLAQAASAIAWQAAALQDAAKAEGRLDAYREIADELQGLGFGQIDPETDEDVEIDGADCVDAVADLYGRVLAVIGGADLGEGLQGISGSQKAELRPVLTAEEIAALEAAVETVASMFDPRDEGQEGDGERIEAARRALAKLKAEAGPDEEQPGHVQIEARQWHDMSEAAWWTVATPAERADMVREFIADKARAKAASKLPDAPESRGEDGAHQSQQEEEIDPDWEAARRWYRLDESFRYDAESIRSYCAHYRADMSAFGARAGRPS